MIGTRFLRWVVLSAADPYVQPTNGRKRKRWLCRCDCGAEAIVQDYSLTSGGSKSCGCFRSDATAEAKTTHGAIRRGKPTSEYRSWCEMLARCENHGSTIFRYYGGRGIRVCKEWHYFERFLADMGPSKGLTLDRIDNEGNYEPGNCRWATWVQQARNRRNNRMVTFRGREMCVAELADIGSLPYKKVIQRLNRGWSPERAIDAVA